MTFSTSNINEIFPIVTTLATGNCFSFSRPFIHHALTFNCIFISLTCTSFCLVYFVLPLENEKEKKQIWICCYIIISTICVRMQVNKLWFYFCADRKYFARSSMQADQVSRMNLPLLSSANLIFERARARDSGAGEGESTIQAPCLLMIET